MNKLLNLVYLISQIVLFTALFGCQDKSVVAKGPCIVETSETEILGETDQIEILSEEIQRFDDDFTIPLVSLSVRDKSKGKMYPLLKTVLPDNYSWYVSDESKFRPISIDSIIAAQRVHIISESPLKIIVEGCPDMRNVYSYLVDATNRKAWYVPANSGFLGETEEGHMIFRSYRYVSDLDIGGRYTFLQVFDKNGCMVDSLDLEHLIYDN